MDLEQQLKDIVGPHGFVIGREVVAALPSLGLSNEARLTLRPGSTDEISRIMRLCSDAGQKVVPHGGLSGAVQGANTTEAEIALSLERMNRIEDINVEDGTMIVQAGVALQTVQDVAAAHGLHFALDLGARGSATIGGNVATNAGGNQVLRYGMAREQILGLEVVLPDGRVLSSMNRMLKNNAAYDLKHLFIGSEGTLGIVTRAVLRLRTALPALTTALVATDDFAKIPKLLGDMGAVLGGQLTSFEVMWQSFYHGACRGAHLGPPPIPSNHAFYILIEASGSDQELDSVRLAAGLSGALEAGLITDAVIAKSDAERSALWAIRDNMEGLAEYVPLKAFDVSMPISRIESYLQSVDQRLHRIFDPPKYTVVGHLGDGNLHLVVSLGEKTPARVRQVEEAVYQPLRDVAGSISGEHGVGLEKRAFLHYCRTDTELEVMRQLKQLFDPKGILNAGKVL